MHDGQPPLSSENLKVAIANLKISDVVVKTCTVARKLCVVFAKITVVLGKVDNRLQTSTVVRAKLYVSH
jgi:hypothetical protein